MNGIVFSICLNAGCAVLAPNGLWWQGQCVFGPCNEQRVQPRPPIMSAPGGEELAAGGARRAATASGAARATTGSAIAARAG